MSGWFRKRYSEDSNLYEKFGSERREEHKTASREDRKRPKSFREQNITFHIITPTPFILLPQDKKEESTHKRPKNVLYGEDKETEDNSEKGKLNKDIRSEMR